MQEKPVPNYVLIPKGSEGCRHECLPTQMWRAHPESFNSGEMIPIVRMTRSKINVKGIITEKMNIVKLPSGPLDKITANGRLYILDVIVAMVGCVCCFTKSTCYK